MLQTNGFAYNVVFCPFSLADWELHCGKYEVGDGPDTAECSSEPHGHHAWDRDQPPLSNRRADQKADRCWDPGTPPSQSRHTLYWEDVFFFFSPIAYSINTEHILAPGLRKHIHFCLLVITATAWHSMHVSFDLMRVGIFSFVCVCKNRTGKGLNQRLNSNKHCSYQLWYDICQTK